MVPPRVRVQSVALRRGPPQLSVLRRPTTDTENLRENQKGQENQVFENRGTQGKYDGKPQENQDVHQEFHETQGNQENQTLENQESQENQGNHEVHENQENQDNRVTQVNQENTKVSPPFDSELFRRSTAAQRNVREFILEAARLVRPQLNLNWRKLTKILPKLKSVEMLTKVAECGYDGFSYDGFSHIDREALLLDFGVPLARWFVRAESRPPPIKI